MKYRKKPVVIEAYQTDKEIVIHTLEGDMKASVGDYIITGVNGEQYPCKPDIFHKTYEPVSNNHFDRIKAMSVKEMANFLMIWAVDCMTGKAPMNVQKWLESEVQGE